MEQQAVSEIARGGLPVGGRAGRTFSAFDPERFGHLSEVETLQRIGALLAIAVIRSGRLSRPKTRQTETAPAAKSVDIDTVELIRDPTARRIARFLQLAGPASPGQLAVALGMKRRTLVRELRLLRKAGLCTVTGRTRAAHYKLRTDFAAN